MTLTRENYVSNTPLMWSWFGDSRNRVNGLAGLTGFWRAAMYPIGAMPFRASENISIRNRREEDASAEFAATSFPFDV